MTAAIEKTIKSIRPLPTPVSFEQFVQWYPENAQYRYELHQGVIIQMPKHKGKHSKLTGHISKNLNYLIDELGVPYFIPRESIVRVDDDTGYEPDVIVLDETEIEKEPAWESASTIENGRSVPLVIEVVSSNWQNDYERKLAGYESVGIKEYWIVDYAGLGGVRHIGRPKQPTVTICTLVEGEYEIVRLRAGETVPSELSSEFGAIAQQILSN